MRDYRTVVPVGLNLLQVKNPIRQTEHWFLVVDEAKAPPQKKRVSDSGSDKARPAVKCEGLRFS